MSTQLPSDQQSPVLPSQYRSEFEQLLTSLSTRFINLPIDSIDEGLEQALGEVGRYTGVDRCFVYQYSDTSQQTARLSHEWCATGVPSIKHQLQDVDLIPLGWVVDQLTSGRVVHIPDAEKLPVEAAGLRQVYKTIGVRAAFYLPLFFKSGLAGMLGFSCVSRIKEWSVESIQLLNVVGQIVVNAVDRRQDFRELQARKEQYESVVQDQTDYIVRWKPDGTHSFVNGAVCRFLGRSADELVGESIYTYIHAEDEGRVRKKIASLTVDSPTTVDEHRVLRSDGTVCWQEWTNRALFDEDGVLVEYQSVGRDITTQKLAHEELLYRQQLENLILNLTSRFINLPADEMQQSIVEALKQVGEFLNVERSFVYTFDDSLSMASLTFEWTKPGAPVTPPQLVNVDVQQPDWSMERMIRGESVAIDELSELPPNAARLRTAFEAIDVASFVIVPVMLQQRLHGFMGISSRMPGRCWPAESTAILRLLGEVFANALRRQATAAALAASEERLSLAISAVADGFYDWNIATGVLYVSERWLVTRELPLDGNELTISEWRTSIHPEDQFEFDRRIAEHLAGLSEVFECEYRVRTGEEEWQWTLDRGRVIERDESGAPLRLVGVERDIDREVTSRRRLQEADARLAHLARVATMGEVVAGIAHEVNQPLHAAATFASAVVTALDSQEPDSAERATRMVNKISAQINRAADIIRRLREFTKPRQVHMARFDLNGLVRESVEMLGFDARQRGIRVELTLEESLPSVFGDRVQIQQVIVNLLRNAYEAVEASSAKLPVIEIDTQKQSARVLLQVSDNGPGLADPNELETLFDAFVTTKEGGMGMGLALCRTIVESHHGRIWGEPNSNGGMKFCVLLNVEPEAQNE